MKWIIIIGIIAALIGLLGVLVYNTAGEKYARREKKFRKWLRDSTPPGKEPLHLP